MNMMKKNYNKNRYNALHIIRDIMAKKHKVGIAAIIGSVILLVINFYVIPPFYASTAKLYIVTRDENTNSKGTNLSLRSMLTRDYAEFVSNNSVLEKVIDKLQIDVNVEDLKNTITVNTPKDTRLIEIRVVSQDPEIPMRLVNALVQVSAEEYTKVTKVSKFNVLEYGSPPLDSEKPDILRIILLGSCYGSLISILFIIKLNKKNERIITAEDIEYWLGLSTLGEIPLEKENAVHTEQLKLNTI